jgi:hypothetical protein
MKRILAAGVLLVAFASPAFAAKKHADYRYHSPKVKYHNPKPTHHQSHPQTHPAHHQNKHA